MDASEQGKIQGALCSLSALATGVGPVVMRYVDHLAGDSFLGPGVMFIFGAFLQFVATLFACLLPRRKTDSRYYGGMDRDFTEEEEEFVH